MGGGLPWWLATTECSPPSPGPLADTLAFLFLSPCPQRALLGTLDLLCLLATLLPVIVTRRSVDAAAPEQEALLLPAPTPRTTAGRYYAVWLGASAVLAATAAVLLALAAILLPAGTPWRAAVCTFLAVHSAAHAAAAWTVFASRKKRAARLPPHLRVFWVATTLAAALFAASAAVRCADGSSFFPDDILSFVFLLVSLPLAYIVVTGDLIASTAARHEED